MAHLSCGIVGLPNAGKSTLFNALTRAGAAVAPYPFCTIDPNVGVVPVPDLRLGRLAQLVHVKTVVYPTVEYVDVAGLVRGASRGEGRGNEFLEHVRQCDALIHVIRCFEDAQVAHVAGRLDPVEDARTVDLELILADLQAVDRHRERLARQARHETTLRPALQTLEKLRRHLDAAQPVRTLPLTEEDRKVSDPLRCLTAKRVLYVANVGDEDPIDERHPRVSTLGAYARAQGSEALAIRARLEDELGGLSEEEARPFLEEMGVHERGLQRLVEATARLLRLVRFFTFNDREARAWMIREGTRAVDAAAVIHTDFARHFVRAEVTPFEAFERLGGEKAAREHGALRIEGRDYIVQDGDIVYFRMAPT